MNSAFVPSLEAAEGSAGAVGAVDERHGVNVAGARLGGVQLSFHISCGLSYVRRLYIPPDISSQKCFLSAEAVDPFYCRINYNLNLDFSCLRHTPQTCPG